MANQSESAQELLLDVKVAESSRLYKFYLNQEKKILGGLAIGVFLIIWELVGNVFQWINPMFMSSPSLISIRRPSNYLSPAKFITICISAGLSFWADTSWRLRSPFPSALWWAGINE